MVHRSVKIIIDAVFVLISKRKSRESHYKLQIFHVSKAFTVKHFLLSKIILCVLFFRSENTIGPQVFSSFLYYYFTLDRKRSFAWRWLRCVFSNCREFLIAFFLELSSAAIFNQLLFLQLQAELKMRNCFLSETI